MAGGKFTERQGRAHKGQTLLTSRFHVGQALTPMQPPSLKVSHPRSPHSILWKDTKYSLVCLLSHKHFPVAALSHCHTSAQVESWSSGPPWEFWGTGSRLGSVTYTLTSGTRAERTRNPSAVTTLIPSWGGTKRKGAVEVEGTQDFDYQKMWKYYCLPHLCSEHSVKPSLECDLSFYCRLQPQIPWVTSCLPVKPTVPFIQYL